jgi:general L-amino acid transport system substrate-binding protein
VRRDIWKFVLVLGVAALFAAGCLHGEDEGGGGGGGGEGEAAQEEQQQEGGGVLDRVRERDQLVCGVNDSVPGFGLVTPEGDYQGFDIEYCRVVAAAVFGEGGAEKVEFRPLTAEERFPALQAGEVDVLIRNTTRTASRDGGEGATFLTTTFYDGAGMMVNADSRYQEIEDMADTTICVLSGTTNEQVLASVFGAQDIQHTPLTFEEVDPLREAFVAGRCDGWTSDKSQLAGIRSQWPENQGGPEALRILDETLSKEPLAPAVRDGDSQWADIVNWAILATIQAEEFGITSQNVQQMSRSRDPEIRRFLGQPVAEEEGAAPEPFDAGLGLEPDFAVQVVSQVGNYGEIYERNLGPRSPLELPRDMNALWTDGGLHYAPPYR